MHLALSKAEIEQSPKCHPTSPVSRDYEHELHDNYGRPKFWGQPGRAAAKRR